MADNYIGNPNAKVLFLTKSKGLKLDNYLIFHNLITHRNTNGNTFLKNDFYIVNLNFFWQQNIDFNDFNIIIVSSDDLLAHDIRTMYKAYLTDIIGNYSENFVVYQNIKRNKIIVSLENFELFTHDMLKELLWGLQCLVNENSILKRENIFSYYNTITYQFTCGYCAKHNIIKQSKDQKQASFCKKCGSSLSDDKDSLKTEMFIHSEKGIQYFKGEFKLHSEKESNYKFLKPNKKVVSKRAIRTISLNIHSHNNRNSSFSFDIYTNFETVTHQYDEKGNRICSHFYTDNVLVQTTINTYDLEGNLTNMKQMFSKQVLYNCTYLYDNKGNIKEEWLGNALHCIYKYSNNCIEAFEYSNDGSICAKKVDVFNESGFLEATYVFDGSSRQKTTFLYDDSGFLVKETEFDEDDTIISVLHFTYDKFGNNTKKIACHSNGTIAYHIENEYQYDRYNNYVKKEEFVVENKKRVLINTITKTIEYYENELAK